MFENLLTTETLTQLKSITVLGNRDELNQTNLVSILLILLDATRVEYQPECIATALQLLSQLLDNNQLTSETATSACKHAVHSMKSFPEDREVLSNGAAVIWICAANFTTECLGEGAYQALEQASKMKKHFVGLNLFLDPNTTAIKHVLTYSLSHLINFFIVIFFIVIFFIVIG